MVEPSSRNEERERELALMLQVRAPKNPELILCETECLVLMWPLHSLEGVKSLITASHREASKISLSYHTASLFFRSRLDSGV
jgi:hypothetical protein